MTELVYVGAVRVPVSCDRYYTYTSRKTCMYSKQLGIPVFPTELVYKDLKTLLCRIWNQKFTVVLPTEEGEMDYEELEVPSCELVMGKRGNWKSLVNLLYSNGKVQVYFDSIQYKLFRTLLENPPTEEEILEKLKEAVEKLNRIYSLEY